jgi:hypothetical protein
MALIWLYPALGDVSAWCRERLHLLKMSQVAPQQAVFVNLTIASAEASASASASASSSAIRLRMRLRLRLNGICVNRPKLL